LLKPKDFSGIAKVQQVLNAAKTQEQFVVQALLYLLHKAQGYGEADIAKANYLPMQVVPLVEMTMDRSTD
jgi:hypothetical protein